MPRKKIGADLAVTTKRGLPRRRRAIPPVEPVHTVPSVAPNEIAGHVLLDYRTGDAGSGEGGESALSATIAELVEHQRVRRFCIKSQSRCDRSVESFIVTGWGYAGKDTAKDDRRKMFDRAATVRIALEKGKDADLSGNERGKALPLVVALSAQARRTWDDLRASTEKDMEKLARTLPAAAWVESVRGLGMKGFAIIIGECADLSGYATKEKVWKRLGLAVINGKRQGRPGTSATLEDWEQHGYNPTRRAEIWALGDSLFRSQWSGDKDADGKDPKKSGNPVAVPAHALGRYGEVYAKRRAWTAERVEMGAHLDAKDPERWTKKRAFDDARRVMTKSLVEDLWRAWREAGARVNTNDTLPPADTFADAA